MAGYDGFSMSNNAVDAYNRGLVPAYKTGVPPELLDLYVGADEWHHTSSRYNATNFYNARRVRVTFGLEAPQDDEEAEWVNPLAIEALAGARKEKKIEMFENCRVKWLEWSGTRAHPRAEEMMAENCRVEIKGKTSTVFFADGRKMTKRQGTNGFSVSPKTIPELERLVSLGGW